jgi:hypothetical protein
MVPCKVARQTTSPPVTATPPKKARRVNDVAMGPSAFSRVVNGTL